MTPFRRQPYPLQAWSRPGMAGDEAVGSPVARESSIGASPGSAETSASSAVTRIRAQG